MKKPNNFYLKDGYLFLGYIIHYITIKTIITCTHYHDVTIMKALQYLSFCYANTTPPGKGLYSSYYLPYLCYTGLLLTFSSLI